MDALTGEARITYDGRGLVELDETVPDVAEVDGTALVGKTSVSFHAKLTLRTAL